MFAGDAIERITNFPREFPKRFAIDREIAAKRVLHRLCVLAPRREIGQQICLACAAQLFRTFEVMRAHYQNEIGPQYKLGRQFLRAMPVEIDALLERDQQRSVRRRRAVVRVGPGTADSDIGQTTLHD